MGRQIAAFGFVVASFSFAAPHARSLQIHTPCPFIPTPGVPRRPRACLRCASPCARLPLTRASRELWSRWTRWPLAGASCRRAGGAGREGAPCCGAGWSTGWRQAQVSIASKGCQMQKTILGFGILLDQSMQCTEPPASPPCRCRRSCAGTWSTSARAASLPSLTLSGALGGVC